MFCSADPAAEVFLALDFWLQTYLTCVDFINTSQDFYQKNEEVVLNFLYLASVVAADENLEEGERYEGYDQDVPDYLKRLANAITLVSNSLRNIIECLYQ